MKVPWNDIEELTKYLKKKGLSEITIETKEGKISLKKDIVTSSSIPEVTHKREETVHIKKEDKSNLYEVTSPMVGTFYSSPSPGSPAFVEVGSTIKKGDVLCIIEAMKIMNELPSEVGGKIKEVLANNGDVVEFGQVLFRIEP